jgi:hypothetical protein
MFSDSDESDEGVEALNKQRKKRVDFFHYPGTAGDGLKRPEEPKKKKRNRKDLDVVGAFYRRRTPRSSLITSSALLHYLPSIKGKSQLLTRPASMLATRRLRRKRMHIPCSAL